MSVLDKANPQKIKIIKAMAEVDEADVTSAMERLKVGTGRGRSRCASRRRQARA